jgi:cation diffusion facilitator CzcD-associated flavoprotein CzcO/NAD(P)-dependent dehydrogenase (short-subunit alcohol dehydrogenase family)
MPTSTAPATTAQNGTHPPPPAHVDVAIVGAGISGIDAAYRIGRANPRSTYVILEARASLGGTWDLFRYPGIRSDSDIATLGFPFRPYGGERMIVDGGSIRDYVADTAREFGIDRHIRFGYRVLRAEWSSAASHWTLACEGPGGAPATVTCRWLQGCTGYYDYERGFAPEWPGMSTFEGRIVYPQFWPDDLDYAGKRVVVIGSGATAVTLVPSMTDRASHVTMLQRSPSYIVSLPSSDPLSIKLREKLPAWLAEPLVRWKFIGISTFVYVLARKRPDRVRQMVRQGILAALGSEYDPAAHDVDVHFNPAYEPWDQRLCFVPDNDLFRALRKGRASIVTGRIAEFVRNGIRLESGRTLEADIVVSATGLNMQMLGGMDVSVDGNPVDFPNRLVYKGMMVEGVPNFAFAFGYTNASWTLKVDLNARYVANVLRFMSRKKYAVAIPQPAHGIDRQPIIANMSSGYIQRALDILPRQGPLPWRSRGNYILDLLGMRLSKIDDGTLKFTTAAKPSNGRAVAKGKHREATAPARTFDKKLVLVTGGGAGIGRAIAHSFAERGADIVVTDIDAEALAETKAEMEGLGVRCETFVANVADEAAMRELADDVEKTIGVPDVLVNNAGIGFLGPFLKSSLDHWGRVFNVNVFGVVNGCYYFLPKMIAAGGKRNIVIVASGASHFPPPNAAAYGASKAAVFSFAESLKMETAGTNVSVTTVCPGITNTSIVRKDGKGNASTAISDAQRARMRAYYEKNGATPQEVAESVAVGVERGKELVLVGPASRLMFNLRRISIPLTRWVNVQGSKRAGFR